MQITSGVLISLLNSKQFNVFVISLSTQFSSDVVSPGLDDLRKHLTFFTLISVIFISCISFIFFTNQNERSVACQFCQFTCNARACAVYNLHPAIHWMRINRPTHDRNILMRSSDTHDCRNGTVCGNTCFTVTASNHKHSFASVSARTAGCSDCCYFAWFPFCESAFDEVISTNGVLPSPVPILAFNVCTIPLSVSVTLLSHG